MGKRRPERKTVEQMLKENGRRKAHDIAKAAGLIPTMGYDRAVQYVKQVKKAMRQQGQLAAIPGRFASDKERLEDITTLFMIRQGKMSQKAAHTMLLLNCYLRLRSEDDKIHMGAIDDTYQKNNELEKPFTVTEAIRICNKALAQYMFSKDESRNEEARKKGYPGSGLNYTNESLIGKCEITDHELKHLKSIRRD